MIKILHISNTDINHDSRIRKELMALGSLSKVEISVVGVSGLSDESDGLIDGFKYFRLRLLARLMRVFPRAISYFFELLEFTAKVVKVGLEIKPHVIHCHDTFALPSGWILGRVLGCKLVYDAHELESKKNSQNSILSYATLLIEKFCWKRIDLFVSVSGSIIDWYIRFFGYKPSIVVLNSPVISEANKKNFVVENNKKYFREKYDIPSSHLIFVYVGILGAGRGIRLCLDAFASGPKNSHIIFVGFGPLEKLILEYSDLNSNIHFHNAVPHDQVVPLIAAADYGLCLIENVSMSDYYCLPNKLFEYCFARLPVLASDFPEISKTVNRYSLGVCCEPKPDKVVEALKEINAKRPTYAKFDLSDLSWEVQAGRLMQAYENQLFSKLSS